MLILFGNQISYYNIAVMFNISNYRSNNYNNSHGFITIDFNSNTKSHFSRYLNPEIVLFEYKQLDAFLLVQNKVLRQFIFVASFVHTDKGFTCSDVGYSDLPDAQTCNDSMSYAKSFDSRTKYKGEFTSLMFPKGCFIYDDGAAGFNLYAHGGHQSDTRSICIAGSY